jgi:hypothetical protein
MPEITTFEARCGECGLAFASPSLSDFVYGEFILSGVSGTAHAHLVAVGNEVCDYISSVVPELDPATFQELIARIADPVNGQRLTMSHVCPGCQSSNWDTWRGQRYGTVSIPSVTFYSFCTLSADQWRTRVLEALNEINR